MIYLFIREYGIFLFTNYDIFRNNTYVYGKYPFLELNIYTLVERYDYNL